MHLLRGLLVLMFAILVVLATKGEDIGEEENHSSSQVVRCTFPAQQIYSHKARKCVSLVHGPCSINKSGKFTGFSKLTNESKNASEEELGHDDSIECISGAVCKQSGLFAYCTCKPGLVDTADRKCALVYGQFCDMSSEVQCDEHSLLGCIEGKCDCANPMHEFNAYSGLCLGKVGAFCKNLSPGQERNYVPNHDYVICGYGAVCFVDVRAGFVQRYSFSPENEFVKKRFENGVCLCNERFGYRETENRTCEYTRRIDESYREEKSENGYNHAGMAILDFVLVVAISVMILIIFIVVSLRGCIN